jgi:hypothetical protein
VLARCGLHTPLVIQAAAFLQLQRQRIGDSALPTQRIQVPHSLEPKKNVESAGYSDTTTSTRLLAREVRAIGGAEGAARCYQLDSTLRRFYAGDWPAIISTHNLLDTAGFASVSKPHMLCFMPHFSVVRFVLESACRKNVAMLFQIIGVTCIHATFFLTEASNIS